MPLPSVQDLPVGALVHNHEDHQTYRVIVQIQQPSLLMERIDDKNKQVVVAPGSEGARVFSRLLVEGLEDKYPPLFDTGEIVAGEGVQRDSQTVNPAPKTTEPKNLTNEQLAEALNSLGKDHPVVAQAAARLREKDACC